ncbi:MAG: succinylglutamate-semialdehyde dehydrogenase [Verrucomicrobiota bacterium]|nr:succinylglutamate-semialdehyde dehydrogenase [Verrucomicrobiota bacterium]
MQLTGPVFDSTNPATGELVWSGHSASAYDVGAAVAVAAKAGSTWSGLSFETRAGYCTRFAETLTQRKPALAECISREAGKPTWEALTEVQAMIGKVGISIEAHQKRCAEFSGGGAKTRFRPHGVVAVFGPFNFPGHLPNGHIVPALLAGNTVLFKPSELTPLVAMETARLWHESGLPEGVLQVLPGGVETGRALAEHPGVHGLFFTGSARVGLHLQESLAKSGKILALEMGGNNPLIAWNTANLHAAAYLMAQSAFITAGQRCTCARRLIVSSGPEGDALLAALTSVARRLRVGPYTTVPEPFCGPVISAGVARKLVAAQSALVAQGGRGLLPLTHLKEDTGLVSPGIMDVTAIANREDDELFGPLLQVIRVADFEAALNEANNTRFGLAAGLISDEPALWQQFFERVHAGIVNWNQPLTGASSAAPFGGTGLSGNYRPGAYFAADYASYAVASMEQPLMAVPAVLPPGMDLG